MWERYLPIRLPVFEGQLRKGKLRATKWADWRWRRRHTFVKEAQR